MRAPSGTWPLVLGSLAFAVFSPASLALAGLAFAGLMMVGGPTTGVRWAVTVAVGVISLLVIAAPAEDLLGKVLAAYMVLATTAFVIGSAVAPTGFLGQALRSMTLGALGVAVCAMVARVYIDWAQLAFDARAQAHAAARAVASSWPEMGDSVARAAPLLAATVPAGIVLATLAALAVAWQWHVRLTRAPLGPPLTRFRDFRIADGAVWGLVGAVAVWIVPALAGLKLAALNLGIVLGALYLLRGAAVIATLAGVLALPLWIRVMGVGSAVLCAVVVAPALCALGVSDTWLEFRRRLVSRPNLS